MEFCPEITKIILIKGSPNRQILLLMDIKRNKSVKSAVITLPYLFIQAPGGIIHLQTERGRKAKTVHIEPMNHGSKS